MDSHQALHKRTVEDSAKRGGVNEPIESPQEFSEKLPTGRSAIDPTSTADEDRLSRKNTIRSSMRADTLRFVVMVLFSFLSITNAMQWIAFSSIVDEVRIYFHMNAAQVNMLPTIYVISYISIVFISCKLYEIAGIKITLVLAALFNAMGAWIKMIALYVWPNPALLFISQVVNSLTEVLIIAAPPLIANRWFPKKERGIANTILSSSLNLGCGIGVLVPTFFVGPDRYAKTDFAKLFWFNFAICTAAFGMILFWLPKRPRYAASFAAQIQQDKEDARLKWLRASHTKEPPGDGHTTPTSELNGRAKEGAEEEKRAREVLPPLPDPPTARDPPQR
ncbi:unnamed protein product [Phytomonas sp. Hart1]|nr:unnamed protein product [Phytomonas sp. Hart1]|eukprot:CCW69750.1 unnamed protein product [Phytomonas sp. isolate Hart1]